MSVDRVLPNEKGNGPPGGPLSDEKLLEAFLEGNQEAFEALFERYRDRVFGYLQRLVGNHAVAEELFQEVFLHLFRHAEQFDSSRTFRSWFYRLAHNRAVDFLRKNREGKSTGDAREGLAEREPVRSPEELALGAETSRTLERMLQMLSGEHRSVLILRFKEGLTYEEIAEVIGCPLGTAKSRTHHAIRRLRKMLGKEK